jgi:hypothetical protein
MLAAVLSLFAVGLLLSRKSPDAGTRLFEPDFTKIRCPQCGWQPRKTDRWFCDPGCRHHWNTFDTAGICPKCTKHWNETACLKCSAWSPHADWYVHESR